MLLTCNFDYSVVYRVVKLSEYYNFIAPSVCFKLLFIFASFSCLIDFAAFLADIYLFVGDGRSNFKVGGFSTLFRHFLKSLIFLFYTAACKFKVKCSDSQNFDKKNYLEGVFCRFSAPVLVCTQILHSTKLYSRFYRILVEKLLFCTSNRQDSQCNWLNLSKYIYYN